jgi:LPS-assembly lipoprotein
MIRAPWTKSGQALAAGVLALGMATQTGCGFQLAGAQPLPTAMGTTFIETTDPYSDFYRALRKGLTQQGVAVTEQRSTATAILRILEDSTGQRVLSVSARNIPREYEVFYVVAFALQGEVGPLIANQEFAVTRSYTFDETQVLGKSLEQQSIQAALADDLARLVLRRLSSAAPVPAS